MQGPFKTYERETRINLTEEVFSSGMNFTNAPLAEGYVKILVNFDVKDDGQMLVPRQGLIVSGVSTYADSVTINPGTIVLAGKHCVQPNAKEVGQVLIGDVLNEQIPDTKIYKGTMTALTVIDDEIYATVDTTQEYKYIKPDKAEIHKLPISDSTPIARHIGTFAFNNDYYCFNGSKLIHTKFNDDTNKYSIEDVKALEITPKEAVMWGYNMLAEDPYTFTCSYASGVPQLLGLLPYVNNKLNLTPRVNEDLEFTCYWAAPQNAEYKAIWEWKDVTGSVWTKLSEATVNTKSLTPWKIKFSSPVPQIMVKLTVFEKDANIEKDLALQVMVVGFNFSKEEYGATANVENKLYSLSTATGMTYWQNRLVIYGVKEDPTILFMSDINNPSYFPYPNNVDVFDEPIIYTVPLLDSLLVFTSSSLYMLTLSTDGTTWNRTLIQSNLNINDWDLHLIRVVKNMVFFKSGNYYYMVVPKLNSLTGELVIAPISKTISGLLDNFKDGVENILKSIYNYKEEVKLIHYYNYLDYEDVHNVYVFKTNDGRLINFTLLYNTIGRYWRIYISETDTILKPYRQDATKKGTLIGLANTKGIQFLEYSSEEVEDKCIIDSELTVSPTEVFKNYQYVDSGFKEHSSDFKKRYREFQVKINNTSQKELLFYTTFTIDSELRRDYYKYTTVHHTDPNSPLYGTLTVNRELVDPSILRSATVLAETNEDLDCWSLDNSIFPDAMFWKIRIPISGKGYAPRLTLLSKNQKSYELLNIAWVFRLLYSR